jgi:hypothetical protein
LIVKTAAILTGFGGLVGLGQSYLMSALGNT